MTGTCRDHTFGLGTFWAREMTDVQDDWDAVLAKSLALVPRRQSLAKSLFAGWSDERWDDWLRFHGCDGYPDLRPVAPGPVRRRKGDPPALQRIWQRSQLVAAVGPRYYVYFIRGGALVKIGISQSPLRRLEDLECASPTDLDFLFAWRVNDRAAVPGNLEIALHREFRDYRRHGEWFDLTEAQIHRCWKSIEDLVKDAPAFSYRSKRLRGDL